MAERSHLSSEVARFIEKIWNTRRDKQYFRKPSSSFVACVSIKPAALIMINHQSSPPILDDVRGEQMLRLPSRVIRMTVDEQPPVAG